jgi:hypothetical protein
LGLGASRSSRTDTQGTGPERDWRQLYISGVTSALDSDAKAMSAVKNEADD